MLSTSECRSLLPNSGNGMTDSQVEQLRSELCAVADAVIGVWENLEHMDQSLLTPSGDVFDQLTRNMEASCN